MPGGLREEIKKMKETLEEMRIQILYLTFDIEATQRERDYYKRLCGKEK